MLKIVKHIETLLSVHDCVIVPELGGFVVQVVPTQYKVEEHRFEPMRKEIVFNETLQYNDGLLIEAYMQAEHTDYGNARQLMHNDVVALKETLQQEKALNLENIGSFRLGEEQQLVFQAGETDWLNATMFGLSAFSFEPLSPQGREMALTDAKKTEVYYIPVSRRMIRTVAAMAGTIVLFFTISTPVKEVNRSAYTASFVPTEMISSDIQPDKKAQPLKMSENEVKLEEIKKEKVEAPNTETKMSKEATPIPEVQKVAPQKTYHVIIASFLSEGQARQYIQETGKKECPNMDVVHNKDKYRVYADRFTDRHKAEKYMESLRKNPKYKDAWLFISL